MRIAVPCLLSAVALLAACSPKAGDAGKNPSGAASGSPATALASGGHIAPRPGVWESQMTMAAGPAGAMTMSSQVCMDEASVKDEGWMNGTQPEATGAAKTPDCTQKVDRTAGGYTFQSSCKTPQGTMTSTGVVTGDFNSAYKMEITSRMDPAPPGAPPESKMAVTARWIGPCAPGQKAGLVPGSMKMAPVKAG